MHTGELFPIEAFELIARENPGAIALRYNDYVMTYSELNEEATRIAKGLQQAGVKAQSVVGVLMHRGPNLLASMLGIFKLRAVYMPLDPGYPHLRLEYMLSRSQCSLVLTDAESDPGAIQIKNCAMLNIEKVEHDGLDIIQLDVNPHDLAYIIFTSGTTGNPKGVMVEQRSLKNHLEAKIHDLKITSARTVAQTASQCFDISIWQFLSALQVGGSVDIISPEVVSEPSRLIAEIRDREISVIQFVPSLLQSFVGHLEISSKQSLPKLLNISTVGEALPAQLCRRWLSLYPDIPILNHYGPTECADGVTHYLVTTSPKDGEKHTPIGNAIQNLKTYIVRDEGDQLTLAPQGETGELYVSGVGLARGYINDPDRTSAVFIDNPFDQDEPYQRLYRTGDLVRMREDGKVECLGRADRQVKLRGYRIELAEIEGILGTYPAIHKCAVTVHTPIGKVKLTARETIDAGEMYAGLPRLIAYVQMKDPCKRSQLLEHLHSFLPSYMVPDLFIEVDAFPLNSNGKLDYKKLPSPEGLRPLSDTPYIEPKTESERKLVSLLAPILEVHPIGVRDNFIDLGGDSLRAMLAINKIQREFNCSVMTIDLYSTSLGGVAEILDQSSRSEHQQIIASEQSRQKAPASHIQKHLWFLWKLDPLVKNYTLQASLDCRGIFNIERFEKAWHKTVNHFDTLSVRFVEEDGEPHLLFDQTPSTKLALIDLSAFKEDALVTKFQEIRNQDSEQPFDLSQGQLCRATLIKIGNDHYQLLVTTHEIVMDAWSLSVMVRTLRSYYHDNETPRDKDQISFGDFTLWEEQNITQERLGRHKAYWESQLSGELPVLAMPSDKPRPAKLSYVSSSKAIRLAPEITEKLKRIAADTRSTLFSTVLSTFYLLLKSYSGQDDIVVGSPHVVREQTGTENLLGFFLNMLPLRMQFDMHLSYKDFLQEVQRVVSEGISYSAYPFSWMIESAHMVRSSNISPVFQVMFNMYSERAEMQSAALDGGQNLSIVARELETGLTKYDLTLYCQEEGDSLYLQFSYCNELFSDEYILRLLQNLQSIIGACCNQPDTALHALEMLHPDEKQFLIDFNGSPLASNHTHTLRELFDHQVKTSPRARAYVWKDEAITYETLDQISNRISNKLDSLGCRAGNVIVVGRSRGIEVIATLLAIVKLHATYVVIGDEYPALRIEEILADVQPKIFLATDKQRSEVEAVDTLVIPFESLQEISPISSDAPPPIPPEPHLSLQIVYTSGSTGKPKGVVIPAKACLNRLHWMWETHPFVSNDVGLVQKSATLVASSWEIFGPLLHGVTSVLIEQEDLLDPLVLLKTIQKFKVTHLLCSPPVITGLVLAKQLLGEEAAESSLRFVTSSAESLPPELARQFLEQFPNAQLFNFYGASECSSNAAWSLVDGVDDEDRMVPIGRPLSNVALYVIDAHSRLLPRGAIGELAVAGDCVAAGYLNQLSLTESKFVPNPFQSFQPFGETLYKTGDLARFNEDDELVLLGRIDNQIKVNGFRIELDELAQVLLEHPSVLEAAAQLHKPLGESDVLVGYVTLRDKTNDVTPSELLDHMRLFLPPHVIPRTVVVLEAMPKLGNGKLDRKQLHLPELIAVTHEKHITPTSATEKAIAEIWSEQLKVATISAMDNFFSLGGSSMISVRCVAIAAKRGLSFTVSDLYDTPVLRDLAKKIDSRSDQGDKKNMTIVEDGIMRIQLLPTMQFIHQYMKAEEHYNMCGLWVDKEQRINLRALDEAVRRLSEDYSVLRSCIHREGDLLVVTVSELSLLTEHIDLGNFSDAKLAEEQVSYLTAMSQHEFKFDGKTPVSRIMFLNATVADKTVVWVFVNIHHLIVDCYSFSLLMEELERYYLAITSRKSIRPVFADSHQQNEWVHALHEQVRGSIDEHIQFWRNQRWDLLRPSEKQFEEIFSSASPSSQSMYKIMNRKDLSATEREVICHQHGTLYIDLDRKTSQVLRSLNPEKDGMDAYDAILCALVEELGNGHDEKGLFIDNLDMLRRPLLNNNDLSSVIGFAVELFPLPLIVNTAHDGYERIKNIRKIRQNMPAHGLGFRAMRMHLKQDVPTDIHELPWPKIAINYHAALDETVPNTLLELEEADLWTGQPMSKNRHHDLRFNITSTDGHLRIQMIFRPGYFTKVEVEALSKGLLSKISGYAQAIEDERRTEGDKSALSVMDE